MVDIDASDRSAVGRSGDTTGRANWRLRAAEAAGTMVGLAIGRAFVGIRRRPFRAVFLAAGALAMAHVVIEIRNAPPPPPAPPPPAPVPVAPAQWLAIERAAPAFHLPVPDLERFGSAHAARRHTGHGGREDRLSFGQFDGRDPFATVLVQRSASGTQTPGSFFVDLARQSALVGQSLTRATQPLPLDTKFGMAELAEVTLAAGTRERTCLAARQGVAGATTRLTTVLCPAEGLQADPATLGCMIDRLQFVAGAEDAGLRSAFAQAERKRMGACPQPPRIRSSSEKR
jgi:hypothetical protein